jgi:hypothetical protein
MKHEEKIQLLLDNGFQIIEIKDQGRIIFKQKDSGDHHVRYTVDELIVKIMDEQQIKQAIKEVDEYLEQAMIDYLEKVAEGRANDIH